jgi:membrane associated rhomboid family serine protease
MIDHCFFSSSYNSLRLEKLGALEWTRVVEKHQGWRLVTCIWLHAGVVHLVANMLSLVFIGIRLEQQFGFGMFLKAILYFPSFEGFLML